jgi:hypothetical protein
MAKSWSYRHLDLLYCEMLSATFCILFFQIIYLTPLFQMPLLCSLQYCIGHDLFENLCWHFSYLLRRSFPWMFAKISKCFLFSGIVFVLQYHKFWSHRQTMTMEERGGDNGKSGQQHNTDHQQPTTDKQWTNHNPPDRHAAINSFHNQQRKPENQWQTTAQYTVKKVTDFPLPSRDVDKQLAGNIATSRLGTGKSVTFFYSESKAIHDNQN